MLSLHSVLNNKNNASISAILGMDGTWLDEGDHRDNNQSP